MGVKLDQEGVMRLLDKLYEQATQGIAMVSPPIEETAGDYLRKNPDIDTAAKKFINYQIAKCTTSGFLAGLGGIITLPVTIPANVSSVLYVQMRMIAGLAYMGGYDTDSDQVQTLVYACLAGISVDQVLKQAGIKFGNKFAMAMVKKIPGEVLAKIKGGIPIHYKVWNKRHYQPWQSCSCRRWCYRWRLRLYRDKSHRQSGVRIICQGRSYCIF